ncbi:MAG: hypothetical protein ACYC3I_27135 [Gemmataceae bacterium]
MDRSREQWGILVAQVVTANCDDPEEVLVRVLAPTLDFLETHLTDLDRQYLMNIHKEIQVFQRDLISRCATARQLIPRTRPGDGPSQALWLQLHRDFSARLPVQLGQLVDGLRQTRADPDPRLKESLVAILQPLMDRKDMSLIPEAERLQELSYVEGGWPGAIQEAMNRIRSELTHRLLALDAPLRETFTEAKIRLVQAIAAAGIRLDETLVGSDPCRGLERLARESDCPKLASSFRFLTDFALTYFGFIHHRIRDALDPLTPDAQPLPVATSGADAYQSLWDALAHALYGIQKRLAGFLTEPAMACFAMGEEFMDQIVRREQIESEWERFTASYRDSLWPDRFAKVEGEGRLYQKWLEAVQQVEQTTTSELGLNLEQDQR